jgi:serine/threonine-protein kinase
MPLNPGTRIGPYEIGAAIGAGGMGEVYRARDTKLNRDVALKILPEAFALDGERIARFRREAQVLASLNHPNIAAIYGFEDSGSIHALVLELVEGPTLADRIAEGSIPLDEALPLAKQIADALEAAHEQGIVHRDLKPANIKLRDDGTVKVLDFGLAKLAEPSTVTAGAAPNVTASPTITTPAMMTGVGVILGTAAYMSPEQAKGRPADKRSDIWAFGCVLYEMLTGRRAFDGEDVSDTLAAVLRGEANWGALPLQMPAAVRTLLVACLRKDAKRRIGDVSTILFILENASAPLLSDVIASERPIRAWPAVAAVLALLTTGIVGVVAGRSMRPTVTARPTVARFALLLPEDQQFTTNGNNIIAISPDGTDVVYVANRRLYLRSMSEFDARPIVGTEMSEGLITGPVFSPDGQSIVYWSGADGEANGALKKIALTGGAATTLCRIGIPAGMAWGPDGILVGQRMNNTVLRVAANGGQPELLVSVKEGRLWGPQMLPGGDILFSRAKDTASAVASVDWDTAQVVVRSLRSGDEKVVVEHGFGGRYLPTKHIIYVSGGTLFAIPFNLERLEAVGRAAPLLDDVGRYYGGTPSGIVYTSVSETGTLAYVSGSPSPQSDVALIERTGQVMPLGLPSGSYRYVRVSPDGTRVALEKEDNAESQIWLRDLRGTLSMRQLTLGGSRNRFPVWSPDGQRIAFQSNREGDGGMFTQRVDGTGAPERLTKADDRTTHVPESWSPDGRTLLFAVARSDASFTLNTVSLNDRRVVAFGDVRSTRYTPGATFSPNGHWVAYASSEGDANVVSGAQIFVQPFPATGARYLISRGLHPLWSPDGKELFYHRLPDTPDHMQVVTITTSFEQRSFTFTNPMFVPIRDMRYAPPNGERVWDMMPDRTRFVGIVDASSAFARGRINVVVNWFEELKQRVPVK